MKELAPIVIGIDFGNTIFYTENDNKIVYPDALRVIRRMTSTPNMVVHIISKVDEEQEKRARKWISDTNFLHEVNLTMDNVHFCQERSHKSIIADKLKVQHHIDDRPEVMVHMNVNIQKYLFRPIPEEVVRYFNRLQFHQVQILQSWNEVETSFFH